MALKKRSCSGFRLYLILDRDVCPDDKTLTRKLFLSLKGGVDIVQLRDKMSQTADVIRRARPLLKMARAFGVPFIINDRLDVAASIDADGLHLGPEDMPAAVARKILGPEKLIGLSCHSLRDVKKAQKEKVDYMGFGPVFRTETKPLTSPLGVGALQKALHLSKKPIFAIGGITRTSLDKLASCPGLRIAVCRDILTSSNPKRATQQLREKLRYV